MYGKDHHVFYNAPLYALSQSGKWFIIKMCQFYIL